MSFFFHCSGETISRHFHNVLHAILSLEGDFFKQSSGEDVPYEILHNSRFYPFFKDCIGAIDGTHSRVKVPRVEVPCFHGRKDHPIQNVLAACGFDMEFTYVLSSLEGIASDSRILKDALSRKYPLRISEGKFYLGDAGFMLKPGILTPYRVDRELLQECNIDRSQSNQQRDEEYRHATLLRDNIAAEMWNVYQAL
ncbi:uncharacterized protein [Arachis hypogaea]|uniref:uncharacterized protein n=1 Tax=Arachis hypogaea TaxID=3818 RepID=UPI0007AF187F